MGLFTNKQSSVPARRANRSPRSVDADNPKPVQFQRNRTLTGSLASHVKGASEQYADLRSGRVQAHDLRKHRKRLWLALVITLFVAIFIGFIIYQSIAIPKVGVISPSGVMVSNNVSEYERKIQDYLSGRPFERSRLTLDANRLTQYLQDNGYPEVERVLGDISFDSIGASKISLVMRQPVVSWSTGTSTMYVDTQGNAFGRNYFSNPVVQVVDETGIEAQDNQVLVSNRFLGFIGKVVGSIEKQGYKVSKIVLPATTTRQILVSVDGVAFPVKMTIDRPAAGQAEDATRSIRYLSRQGIAPAEYLDVRVSGKAFYK